MLRNHVLTQHKFGDKILVHEQEVTVNSQHLVVGLGQLQSAIAVLPDQTFLWHMINQSSVGFYHISPQSSLPVYNATL